MMSYDRSWSDHEGSVSHDRSYSEHEWSVIIDHGQSMVDEL